MALTMAERASVATLARLLYDFLPASGNTRTSFPIASQVVGLADAWPQGRVSKEPAVVALLTWTLENRRDLFCALIQEIVAQSMTWRGRGGKSPLTREEVEELNTKLVGVRFQIPELKDPAFLNSLESSKAQTVDAVNPAVVVDFDKLKAELFALSELPPGPRGYAFERFLSDAFACFNLAPRDSFRNTGEQIDGSFVLNHQTYLLEAKWQGPRTGVGDLRSFAGKVTDKATWSRGLFISNSGFSEEGLSAFGRQKPIILMDGFDLFTTLERKLSLVEVLQAKDRRAVETGRPFVSVREIYN
jgi:hypothetical protein